MAISPSHEPVGDGSDPGRDDPIVGVGMQPATSEATASPPSRVELAAVGELETAQAGVESSEASVEDAKPEPEPPEPKSAGRFGPLKELPVLLLLAFLLALLIKTFLVQAFYIPSASMEPTLMIGDRVLVNKIVYHFHPPRRGDIIVFQDPHGVPVHRNPVAALAHWVTEGLGVAQSPDKDFIKRVIGVPGDRVSVQGGVVYINGKPLRPEPYISPVPGPPSYGPVTVPAGELFVMGDNRGNSNDSRGTLGFIPISKVVGRAFVTIWPPGRLHWLSKPSYAFG